jgi:hypothetical protein
MVYIKVLLKHLNKDTDKNTGNPAGIRTGSLYNMTEDEVVPVLN